MEKLWNDLVICIPKINTSNIIFVCFLKNLHLSCCEPIFSSQFNIIICEFFTPVFAGGFSLLKSLGLQTIIAVLLSIPADLNNGML